MSQTRFVCKCECGGNVRGVCAFGQWFTWCTKCTPAVDVNSNRIRSVVKHTLDAIKQQKEKR